MTFLALAGLSAYLTFFLLAAAIAPYGGHNFEVFRVFIYGPGPGWYLLPAWWLLAVCIRIYSFLVLHQKDGDRWKMFARRTDRAVDVMLFLLVGLEILIAIDYRDVWF